METPRTIFTFGSNLAGRHGAGSALKAFREYGAVWGQGIGLHGDSYAIPTKDEQLKVLPLNTIKKYVKQFIRFAELNPQLHFVVVRIGCGLAGYTDEEIAPLFHKAPANCLLPVGWRNISREYYARSTQS